MRILVIGGGGREHALAWRLAQSESVDKLYATPGNPGIATVAECVPSQSTPESFLAVASSVVADLTVVGPEAPLAAGITDLFETRGVRIFGPSQAAAQLESSKIFAKQFMQRVGLPTARFVVVGNESDALHGLDRFSYPVVLKADGLAAGKGVIIARDRKEAEAALAGLGGRLVIEEYLEGEEVSFIVVSDGRNALPLDPTQDHKAVWDGDTGPNTGGMGAYCDHRILSSGQTHRIMDSVILPTIDNMRAGGIPFRGFLYAGLMMTKDGPKVLEFNVRLGDPETQALLHRMDSDFAAVLDRAARGDVSRERIQWKANPSVCVVAAAHGYPGKVRSGDAITGIEDAEATGAVVFQAGTKMGEKGLETSGGRVLGVTASGETLGAAIADSYAALDKIHFDGMHYRRDIGRKGLARW